MFYDIERLNELEKHLSENLMQADGKTWKDNHKPFWINYRNDIPNCLMVIREYREILRQYESKKTLEKNPCIKKTNSSWSSIKRRIIF